MPSWTSQNGMWKIFKVNGKWAIKNLKDGYIDWPIAYKGTTKVAYDDPYRIPAYVKKQYLIMKHRDRGLEIGTKVKLRADVLRRHSGSVPAHLGFTKEQFAWRDTLGKLKSKIGIIDRTFPNSKHVNVRFGETLIGIDQSELIEV